METFLQIALIAGTIVFFVYIVDMIRLRKLELRYTLLWLFTSVSFIFMAIFPGIIKWVAEILSIKEPVNALFLITLFFLIMIIFSLTVAIAAKSRSIIVLTQEIGMMKFEISKLKTEVHNENGTEKRDGDIND
ncbi:MAG: DUF2304 domain-containing protein [Saccharofermentanales bacterium]